MKIMTEGNSPKAKFKRESPKINRETLTLTLLNSLKGTNGGELLLTANPPKY